MILVALLKVIMHMKNHGVMMKKEKGWRESECYGGNDDDNGNDSGISWPWSESEEEDSEMDMDDYSDMGDSIEPYYSERSQEEEEEMRKIKTWYDYTDMYFNQHLRYLC